MCRIETDIQKKLYRRRKSSCPEDDQQVFRRIKIFYIFASYHWTCLVCVFPGSGRNDPGADRLRQQYGRIDRICSYCYFYHFRVC